MKYFVTGATGFLGSHLVRQLIESGDEVVALVFEPEREETVRSWGAETVVAGLDQQRLADSMVGCDGVFHVAGYVSLNDMTGDRSRSANVDGARAVVQAAVRAGVKRLVHTSSLVTIGGTLDGRVLNESDVFECGDLKLPYLETKRAGERVVLSQHASDLEVVVCNPCGMIGPEDPWGSEANVVFDMYRSHRVRVVPHVRNNWGDVRDVAAGEIAAMQRGRSGQRYFLGARNTTLKDLMASLDRAVGERVRHRIEFGWPWTMAIGQVAARLQRRPVITPNVARFMRYAFWVSHEKASLELGYSPRPIEETLRDAFEWFEERGVS